jgi:hypothetical protein
MHSLTRMSRVVPAFILLGAAACQKAKPAKNPADAIVPDGVPALDLGAGPQILFQVFGDRESPHMIPIAAVVKGVIKPIGLTQRGWKQLDTQFMAAGTKYPFYVEGSDPGELTVVRDTTYSLPGCSAVKPMAVVNLAFSKPRADPTVEFLASSAPRSTPHVSRGTPMSPAEIEKLARAMGHEAGKRLGLGAAQLDSLDFSARLVATGASAAPTLVISFIDPGSADYPPGTRTGHVFALADSGANGYEVTYAHVVNGDARTVEFQRFVNHVDVNGSEADEVIVEAWKYASDNDLVVLTFKAGRWLEALRVRQDWCLDVPVAKP